MPCVVEVVDRSLKADCTDFTFENNIEMGGGGGGGVGFVSLIMWRVVASKVNCPISQNTSNNLSPKDRQPLPICPFQTSVVSAIAPLRLKWSK